MEKVFEEKQKYNELMNLALESFVENNFILKRQKIGLFVDIKNSNDLTFSLQARNIQTIQLA